MSSKELQSDEREALLSIYEGDDAFKEINSTTYQYKYGEDDDNKSFMVQIEWGEDYPFDIPKLNMETFFNRNLHQSVKDKILATLFEECQQWVGCGMTYTLFECLKDKIDELFADLPEKSTLVAAADLENDVVALKISEPLANDVQSKLPKKEQLTKSQKRRQWEKTDHKGDKPRGWDWVDIVKHLSQTGGKNEHVTASSNSTSASVISNPSLPLTNLNY